MVTGPSPARGQEPTAHADPLAVLAEVLDRTSSATTAIEAMREAQAFATHSGHLLTMWSAAVRAEAYAAVDRAVQERLSPAEYERYEAEPQRPVFQRLVLGAVLAGAELGAVVDDATARDFTAARSVAAVMHGRLEAAGYRMGQAIPLAPEPEAALSSTPVGEPVDASKPTRDRLGPLTWATRVPEIIGPEARQLGLGLGEALDARGRELADAQAERAEPWVLETLGAFPAEGSAALRGDWLARVGQAAMYREAAGITNPRQVVGPVPEGHPVLAAAHADAVRALEIRDPNQLVWAIPRAELEATVAAYERVAATAPREVSAELRAERQAEADARVRALELQAQGQTELAAQAEARADAGNVRATELEGAAEGYAVWEESTAPQREAAELAQAELSRRGVGAKSSTREAAVTPASAPVSAGPEAEAYSSVPDLKAAMAEPGDLDVEAVAGDVDEALDQLPKLDTSTVNPVTEARLEELAARKAAQAEAAEDEARREANREAYAAAQLGTPEPGAPSAWVRGLATPEWGGPQASTPEPESLLENSGGSWLGGG